MHDPYGGEKTKDVGHKACVEVHSTLQGVVAEDLGGGGGGTFHFRLDLRVAYLLEVKATEKSNEQS